MPSRGKTCHRDSAACKGWARGMHDGPQPAWQWGAAQGPEVRGEVTEEGAKGPGNSLRAGTSSVCGPGYAWNAGAEA